MPEGDTIFRTAATMKRWLEGREVTRAEPRIDGARGIERVVGSTIDSIEARAKHLLIRFSSGDVLHTHMRMTGSWHVYRTGERWKKPGWQARLVLEAGERQAVCFNAPVVELLKDHEERAHPSLAGLGPDVLVDPLDLAEIRRRARNLPEETPVGEMLLDQQVLSGVGNIYRAESLFARRLDPWALVADVDDEALDALVVAASDLMRVNVGPSSAIDRNFGGGPGNPWVYGREGRPCRRCRTPIQRKRMGEQARSVYWCPRCQAPSHT